MKIHNSLNNTTQGNPIFICGYPKSGTTLLLSLFDGHPELLVIPEETSFFSKVIKNKKSDMLSFLLSRTNISVLRRDKVVEPSGVRDFSALDYDLLVKSSKKYWNKSKKENKDVLESLVYGLSCSLNVSYFKYWVEKSPFNENFLDIQNQYWKNCKSIMIVRDPRQTFCSHREYQKKKLNTNKIRIATFVEKWSNSLNNYNDFLDKGGRGIIVRYETLVNDTECVMKNIVDFIGISFDKKILFPTRCGKNWEGNSSLENEKFQKVTKRSINFSENLTKYEIQYIENKLNSLMQKNNYKPIYGKNFFLPIISMFYYFLPKIDAINKIIIVKIPQFIKKIVLLK